MSKQPGGNGPKGPEDKFGSFSELNEKLAAEREAERQRVEMSLLERSSQSLTNDLYFRSKEIKNSREICHFLEEQKGLVDGKSLMFELRNYYRDDKEGNAVYEGVDLLAESGFGPQLEELFQKNEFNETYKAGKALLKKVLGSVNKAIDDNTEILSRTDSIKDSKFIVEILNNSVNDWKEVARKLPKKLGDKLLSYLQSLFGEGGTIVNYLIKEFRNKQRQAIDPQALKSLMNDELFPRTEDVLLNSLLEWKTSPNSPIMVNSSEFAKLTRENELSITDVDSKKLLEGPLLALLENGHFEKNKVDLSQLVNVLRSRYSPILDAKKDSEEREAFLDVLTEGNEAAFGKYKNQLAQIKSVFDAYVDNNFDRDLKDWLDGKEPKKTPSLKAQAKVLFSVKQMLDMGDQYFTNWLLISLNDYAEKYEKEPSLPGKKDFDGFFFLWTNLKNKKLLNEKNYKASLSAKFGVRDQQKIGELIESEDEHKWSALESLFRRKFNLPDKKYKSVKSAKKETTPAPVPETTNAEMPAVVLSPENEAQAEKIKVLIKSLADEDFPLLPAIFGKFDFKNKNEYWDELVTRIRPEDYPALVEMLEILETIGERFNKTIDLGFSSGSIGNLDKIFFGDESFKKLFVIDPKDKITIIFDKASLDAWQKLYTRYVNKFLKLLEDPLFPEVKENLKLNLEELVNNDGKINEQLLNAALSELKKIKKAQVGPEEKK